MNDFQKPVRRDRLWGDAELRHAPDNRLRRTDKGFHHMQLATLRVIVKIKIERGLGAIGHRQRTAHTKAAIILGIEPNAVN